MNWDVSKKPAFEMTYTVSGGALNYIRSFPKTVSDGADMKLSGRVFHSPRVLSSDCQWLKGQNMHQKWYNGME